MIDEHSIIPPSSSEIWGAPGGCTGWVAMSKQYPDTGDSEDSRNGTASHEIGAELITYWRNESIILTASHFVGKQAINGVVFTQEMYDGALLYANDVINVINLYDDPVTGVEQRLTMPEIHEKSFGTTDAFVYDSRVARLYVWDYKFGHETVEAFENWQTMNYINGIIRTLPNIENWNPSSVTVHIRIVQPRAFHRDGTIREWITTLAILQLHFKTLHNNAHIALSPASVIRSGPHCKHCQARHACPAGLKCGMGLFEVSMQPTGIDLTPEALGVQLAIVNRAIKQLEYLQTGFTEQVNAVIKNGSIVPNFALEIGVGRLSWSKPANEIIALGNVLGIDLQKHDAIKTPTQAKQLGIDETVIEAYSEKPKTGLKLVSDNGNKAKMVFN